jgi:MerR family transcriptional regulator, light-induced transcriptional regulator
MPDDRFLTTGEFSRRVGVSVELLRAWERRYGVPKPARSPNGRRMYTRDDERAVAEMRRALTAGMPAAAAAQRALHAREETAAPQVDGTLDEIAAGLREAMSRLEETAAQEQLDRLFGSFTIDTALRAVVLPYLHEVGERWAANEIGIGDEHFAANLIHGRLLSLARTWDSGRGPRALLACPPGELHTIGLLAFGLALRGHGWRITFLGADTPTTALADVAATIAPARIVLSSVNSDAFHRARTGLAELTAVTPIAIGGPGASPVVAAAIGADVLSGDPVSAAASLT